MSDGQRIRRNATHLLSSQLVTWVLALLLAVFLPRHLGAEGVGKLNLANSLWAMAAVGIAFGLDTFLVKETAREPGRASELVGDALVLRIGLYLVALVLMLGYVALAGYSSDTVAVIFIFGVSTLLYQCTAVLGAAVQGLEQMQFVSRGNIVGKLVIVGLCLVVLWLDYGVRWIAATYSIAALLNFVLLYRPLSRMHPISIGIRVDHLRGLLRSGLPYVLSSAFLVAYQQLDTVIISWLVDERAVGLYGVSAQLFGTLLFMPTILTGAIFPTMSRMQLESPEQLRQLMRRSFDLLVVFSVSIGLGLLIVAQPLVRLLYGEAFAPSGVILSVMGLVLIVTYLNMLVGQFLIAVDRQKAWSVVLAGAAVATLALDLLLVPLCEARFQNGALGGAISFLLTEVAMLGIGLRLLPAGTLNAANAVTAAKSLVAGAIMVAATWWSRHLFVGIPIVIGMLVYPAAVLLLRTLSPEDTALLRGAVAKIRGRVTRTGE